MKDEIEVKVNFSDVDTTTRTYEGIICSRFAAILSKKGITAGSYKEKGYELVLVSGPIVITIWYIDWVPIMSSTAYPLDFQTLYIKIKEF